MKMTAILHAAAITVALSVGAQAIELEKPTGEVILTVGGTIANTNEGEQAEFDLAMLDALPQRTTTTITPWYPDQQTFSGVIVKNLLDAVGAEGTMVTVTAINDYSAEIPIEDFQDHPVILASRIGGEELSIRDKGPLFVVYPFDLDSSLYNEVFFGRSVWQVKSITIH